MNFKNIILFGLGAAVGAVVTQQLLKQKYEDILQEEIQSVKEVFGRNKIEKDEEENNEEEVKNSNTNSLFSKKQKKNYANMVQYCGYAKNSEDNQDDDEEDEEENSDNDIPQDYEIEADSTNSNSTCYIIPPEEFGALYDYDAITLQYFNDDVLTDDFNVLCANRDEIVPDGFERHYGEYEDDTVYVRNAILKADYEIIRVDEDYSDIVNNIPPHYQ